MVVSIALTTDTSRALITGEPVRVAEGVGVMVAAPDTVGVGVEGVPDRVGVTVRVRVGVVVPRDGVRVGVAGVPVPWQIPALQGGLEQQPASSTHEKFWNSDVHTAPGHSSSPTQSAPLFWPAVQTPAQNLPVATQVEPPHWESRRHPNPLKLSPPPMQIFADPVHGRLPAQLKDVSQQSPARMPPEQVPNDASTLHTGCAEQLLARHGQKRPSSSPPSQTPCAITQTPLGTQLSSDSHASPLRVPPLHRNSPVPWARAIDGITRPHNRKSRTYAVRRFVSWVTLHSQWLENLSLLHRR